MSTIANLGPEPVTCYGWELGCTVGRSDKFYRVLLCPVERDAAGVWTRWVAAMNYGRNGTAGRGQWTMGHITTRARAFDFARAKTDEKIDKGYVVVYETVGFTLGAQTAACALGLITDEATLVGRERLQDALNAAQRHDFPVGAR